MHVLDGAVGDPIHSGDSVYFDRMYGSNNWVPTYSIAATTSHIGGTTSMASRSVFIIGALPPER